MKSGLGLVCSLAYLPPDSGVSGRRTVCAASLNTDCITSTEPESATAHQAEGLQRFGDSLFGLLLVADAGDPA